MPLVILMGSRIEGERRCAEDGERQREPKKNRNGYLLGGIHVTPGVSYASRQVEDFCLPGA